MRPQESGVLRKPRFSSTKSTRLLGLGEISGYVVLKHLLSQGGIRKLKPLDTLVMISEGMYFPTGSGCEAMRLKTFDRKHLLRSMNSDDLVRPR